jgi:hypothetical protein
MAQGTGRNEDAKTAKIDALVPQVVAGLPSPHTGGGMNTLRIGVAVAIMALLGVPVASAETCGSAEHLCHAVAGSVTTSDQQIAAAMQQEIVVLQGVMVKLLLVQQETLNTLHQIQAAQVAKGQK